MKILFTFLLPCALCLAQSGGRNDRPIQQTSQAPCSVNAANTKGDVIVTFRGGGCEIGEAFFQRLVEYIDRNFDRVNERLSRVEVFVSNTDSFSSRRGFLAADLASWAPSSTSSKLYDLTVAGVDFTSGRPLEYKPTSAISALYGFEKSPPTEGIISFGESLTAWKPGELKIPTPISGLYSIETSKPTDGLILAGGNLTAWKPGELKMSSAISAFSVPDSSASIDRLHVGLSSKLLADLTIPWMNSIFAGAENPTSTTSRLYVGTLDLSSSKSPVVNSIYSTLYGSDQTSLAKTLSELGNGDKVIGWSVRYLPGTSSGREKTLDRTLN